MKISRANLRQIIHEELKEVLQPKSKSFKVGVGGKPHHVKTKEEMDPIQLMHQLQLARVGRPGGGVESIAVYDDGDGDVQWSELEAFITDIMGGVMPGTPEAEERYAAEKESFTSATEEAEKRREEKSKSIQKYYKLASDPEGPFGGYTGD